VFGNKQIRFIGLWQFVALVW